MSFAKAIRNINPLRALNPTKKSKSGRGRKNRRSTSVRNINMSLNVYAKSKKNDIMRRNITSAIYLILMIQ